LSPAAAVAIAALAAREPECSTRREGFGQPRRLASADGRDESRIYRISW
jgi:hypothetical protein